MSTQQDKTLDDSDPSLSMLGGDVDGNGIVSASATGAKDGLHPQPPATKALSKKGYNLLMLGGAGIAGAIVIGILMSGQNAEVPGAAADAAASGAPPAAPSVAELSRAQQLAQGQAGADGAAGAGAAGAAGAAQPVEPPVQGVNPATGGANAAPTHSEQFRDWLQKHRYDRLRAAHVADQQARVAQVIDQGGGAPGGGGGGMQQMQQQVRAPVVAPQYTGQPRPPMPQMPQMAGMPPGMPPGMTGMPQMAGMQPPPAARPAGGAPASDPNVAAQERNRAFAAGAAPAGYLDERVRPQAAQNEISAGTIIPAVMLTAINSDLPGSIVAQVRLNVYDTFDFRALLIPAGTRLVGRYSSDINAGQQRVLVAWDEMIFPNGSRINLAGMQGTDPQGAAGFADQVRTHFWRTWGNALLVSLIGAATQQSQPQNQSTQTAPGGTQQAIGAVGGSLNETAQQVLRRNLNVAPTLEIRPGYTFNVLVNQSVVLPVYRER